MDLSNENIVHIKNGDIEYLQFRKLLEYKELKHAYALKNLDFRKHDSNNAINSYGELLEKLDINLNTLVKPHQSHTDNILVIDKKINKDEPDIYMDYLMDIDGTITEKSNITLTSTNADCIILLIYDPIKKVIASIHSGWRGTFKKVSQKAIQIMKKEFDCNPENIIVCICPSIRICHFEVDLDVKEECEKIFSYLNKNNKIIKIGEIKGEKQKYFIDTVLITKLLLKEEKIKEENIIDSNICSVCECKNVHSRRAEGINYGLGGTIITKK